MAYKFTQTNPGAATAADLYTVPAGKEAVVSTLAICNRDGAATAKYKVWLRPGGVAAANSQLLAFDSFVGTNDTVALTIGIAMSASDVLTVEADTATVTFTAFINETDM